MNPTTHGLSTHAVAVTVHPVSSGTAALLLRRYCTELVERYHGRATDDDEVDAALAGEPSDDLVPPTGQFLTAHRGGDPLGCVGVRVLDARTTELTRLFVVPQARGTGLAGRLVQAAEDVARDTFGARRMRLDTRTDLVEARALYARHGYREMGAYNAGPYADHWFEKPLR